MKFFEQQGATFRRTHLATSENVCDCCQAYDHEAAEYHHDDVECPRCGKLCRCSCHRQKSST